MLDAFSLSLFCFQLAAAGMQTIWHKQQKSLMLQMRGVTNNLLQTKACVTSYDMPMNTSTPHLGFVQGDHLDILV